MASSIPSIYTNNVEHNIFFSFKFCNFGLKNYQFVDCSRVIQHLFRVRINRYFQLNHKIRAQIMSMSTSCNSHIICVLQMQIKSHQTMGKNQFYILQLSFILGTQLSKLYLPNDAQLNCLKKQF